MKLKLFILSLCLPLFVFGQKAQIDLPISWDDTATVNYTVSDFGGNSSMVAADPANASNLVLESTKSNTAQTWAGTTLGTSTGFATAVPFAQGSTVIKAVVYSPDTATPVRLKVEDASNAAISVETEVLTTVANAWDTLTFDFSNHVSGTAAINFANTYDKMSIFYNFGTDGATAGTKTYYLDDVFFVSGSAPAKAQIDLPITWDDSTNVDYTVTDFGGNSSMVAVDPANASNLVLESTKSNTAQTWAGTTLSTPAGLATAIPFAAGSTVVKAVVYSPDANTPVRLKVEDAANGAISVETEVLTSVANAWDTLTFDFSNHVSGTAAINFANTYNKMSIFYNFGTDGATAGTKTYYLDDVFFVSSSAPAKAQIDLPITWDDTTNVDYTVTDFGGNASMVITDPNNANNLILESIKTGSAQTWAGTTLGTPSGLATPIPFAQGSTIITVVVWSPDANTPVRLKAEDATDPTISVETEVQTTVANAWDTLSFDFANEATGTAAINFANTYDKLSIFYNFGTDGATAGSKTYYCDDVFFGAAVPALAQIDLPITWDDSSNVDYTVTDFGGNASAVVADPTDPSNMVLESNKTGTAELWAGTTLGTPAGLATAIPFAQGSTVVSVDVWSPDAGTPIRLKAEDATDPSISVETEVQTTTSGAWETLQFDFSNEVSGTAAINFANTYDKLSIFYNFGTTGAAAGAKTYYCDNVVFGSSGIGLAEKSLANISIAPNPSHGTFTIQGDLKGKVHLHVINSNGQLVFNKTWLSNGLNETLQLDLANGIYLVKLSAEGTSVTERILIRK